MDTLKLILAITKLFLIVFLGIFVFISAHHGDYARATFDLVIIIGLNQFSVFHIFDEYFDNEQN